MLGILAICLCSFFRNASIWEKIPILGQPPGGDVFFFQIGPAAMMVANTIGKSCQGSEWIQPFCSSLAMGIWILLFKFIHQFFVALSGRDTTIMEQPRPVQKLFSFRRFAHQLTTSSSHKGDSFAMLEFVYSDEVDGIRKSMRELAAIYFHKGACMVGWWICKE
jgi:hypothetical protein